MIMNFLTKISVLIDKSNLILGRTTAWLTLAIILLTALTVIQRYIFSENYAWEVELIFYIHSFIFLASAGYVLQTNSHVRIDILYEKMSERQKAIYNLIGTILFLLPVCITIMYFSYDFISNSWHIREKSREYNGLPATYILKSFIWLFSLSLIAQGISTIITGIKTIKGCNSNKDIK